MRSVLFLVEKINRLRKSNETIFTEPVDNFLLTSQNLFCNFFLNCQLILTYGLRFRQQISYIHSFKYFLNEDNGINFSIKETAEQYE